jgi:hypothetical protein
MANNRQEEFKNKLFSLLREYNVEMQVEEEYKGYCSNPNGISFFAYGVYDENSDKIDEGIDFKVGNYVNGK